MIAQFMGHANVDTTLNVYTLVLDGALRAAGDTIGGNCSQLFTGRRIPERQFTDVKGFGAPCTTRTYDLLVRRAKKGDHRGQRETAAPLFCDLRKPSEATRQRVERPPVVCGLSVADAPDRTRA